MRRSTLSLAAGLPILLLVACTEPATDDADGDGVPAARDCDDNDARVGEPTVEVCNGLDDDCDGTPDEDAMDATPWRRDADGDGFGSDIGDPVRLCQAPDATGWVDDDQDCNDAFDTVFPGADELCDGLDNDCDDTVDEDPIDPITFYADADEDGWGDPDNTQLACGPADGFVSRAGDCNDAVPTIHTTADETCNGVDDDCNDAIDDDAIDAPTWFRDFDLDGHAADGAEELRACARPDGFAASIGDCDDSEPRRSPGNLEICDGLDNDCDSLTVDDDKVAVDGNPATDLADAVSKAKSGSQIDVCKGAWVADVSITQSMTLNGPDARADTLWTTAGGGSMITVGSGVELVVSGITFVDGEATRGGAIDAADATSLTVKDCAFEGNAAEEGGAIYVGRAANLDVSDSSFVDNIAADDGGAVYAGTSTLFRVTLDGNGASRGGGLAVDGGDSMLDIDTIFDGNSASVAGGAIAVLSANSVSDGELENNDSDGDGGAVWLADGATLLLTDIHDNSADGSGGGIACAGACAIESATVSSNIADNGGGLAALGAGAVDLTGASVTQNVAVGDGGGLLIDDPDADVTVDGGAITSNEASAGGGAALRSGTLTSVSVDWGTSSTDNDPDDVDADGSSFDAYGSGASFECSAEDGTCR